MRLIRSAAIFLGFASLILSSPLRAAQEGYSYARIVRLSVVQGEVQLTRSSSSDWENAIPNMPVQQGFTVATNNGRAEIEFESGAVMWIAENTVVQFTELALTDGGRITRLTMTQGAASFEVKQTAGDVFEVAAGGLHATIPERAKFRVDASRENPSVRVFNGSASVNDGTNTVTVLKGQTYSMDVGDSSEPGLSPNPKTDSWDAWVNDRAGQIARGETATTAYADAPVSYGMSDLSSYGNWVDCPGYGFGWQPWGTGASWAPFYDGYFDFYNGLGWTWISFEPWGWAPYHFGNWAYAGGCGGWMWYPGGFGFWDPAPLIFVGIGNGRFGWRPRPVPWKNPRELGSPLTRLSKTPEPGKPSSTPIVIGAKGGIGDGFPTAVLAPDKEPILVETSTPPGKNGKFSASEAEKTNVKAPLAVTTARNLAELRGGIAFDAAEYRFVTDSEKGHAVSEGAALERQPVTANGVRDSKAVPHAPAPSGFVFSREAISKQTATGHSGFFGSLAHVGEAGHGAQGGGFSHGAEAAHGGGGSAASSSGSHGGAAPAAAPAHH
jgi:FecR protein